MSSVKGLAKDMREIKLFSIFWKSERGEPTTWPVSQQENNRRAAVNVSHEKNLAYMACFTVTLFAGLLLTEPKVSPQPDEPSIPSILSDSQRL